VTGTRSQIKTETGPLGVAVADWWRNAVVYQIYLRSFADADGDGIGDMRGIADKLPYLADLGVDAIWITPFYPSPGHDQGYDVSDHCAVDPVFGELADVKSLFDQAHARNIKMIVDIVPNHTSVSHPWFASAIAEGRTSQFRDRYHFRDGRGPDGSEPPNNWESFFGGPAWTRTPDGQWYLHLFDSSQPDLNWGHPAVADHFDAVIRFWLDLGADGIRVDVAHGLVKEASLRDQIRDHHGPSRHDKQVGGLIGRDHTDEPMWDQPGVHEIARRWRRLLDSYPDPKVAVAEAWTQTPERLASYVRPDEFHQAFNFDWLAAPWGADSFRAVIDATSANISAANASPTWVLSNHDVVRHRSRYGAGAQGLARAKAATLVMLGLPGSAYLYQGEELGLPEVDVPPDRRCDPVWFRTGEPGRDGCRIPLPWHADQPHCGFGTSEPWLPQPVGWSEFAVSNQSGVAGSTLEFYRSTLRTRRELPADVVAARVSTSVVGDVLVVERGALMIAINCGDTDVPLPPGRVVASSAPVDTTLSTDCAVWLLTGQVV
jgi:alpha-glucosidase